MIKVFIVLFVVLPRASTLKAQDSARINLLLESSLLYVLKSGMEKNDYDSALYYADRAMMASAKEPVWQARCLQIYSQLYRENGEIEKGKNHIDKAIAIFTKNNCIKDLGNAYMELQNYFNIYAGSEWASKIKYTEEAVRFYRESGNKLKQADALKHLADYNMVRAFDSTALNHLYDALAIYKSIEYEEVQGVYDLIGFILWKRNDFQQALKYGLLAVQTAEKFKASEQELCTIYNRLGLTYNRLLLHQEAINSFNRAFSLALKIKDTVNARVIAPNIISMFLRLNKQPELIAFLTRVKFMSDDDELHFKEFYLSSFISTYLLTGDYKKAEPYVRRLQALVNDSSKVLPLRFLYRAVIPYYLAAGQYKKMYRYLPAYETLCHEQKIVQSLSDNYLWWYKADSALGNNADAITHYKLYKEASDSSLRLTASQQINQLLVQHEAYKKDQELVIKENNIVLLTSQAKLQRQQLTLTYGLAGLLLLVMALLFNRYRLKQRQQQVINDKNIFLQKVVNQKEKLLIEKEWLLKEVHHRVKNNMHIIISLLNLQSVHIDNEIALSAIHESENRVHAMSLIHQKLYNSENVSSIDMSVYIRELVLHLSDSFNSGQNIRFELTIEPVEMDVSQAIPLGLILNEAVTNSIKYAFPHKRSGVISVTLANCSRQRLMLVISDNGIGIPMHLSDKSSDSLGMSLITGLTDDLEGNLDIINSNGTTIKISFDMRPLHSAVLS